jgi:hypothetical protein
MEMSTTLLLQTDRFDTWAKLDLDTDKICYLPSKGYTVDGKLSFIGERRIVFCRPGGKGTLHLRIDDKDYVCDTTFSIDVHHISRTESHVSIRQSDHLVFSWDYPRVLDPVLQFFDFTQTDDEDFDIFFFVRNVLADSHRKQEIYRHSI